MARPVPKQALDAILEILAGFPDGAAIDQIETQLAATPTRRTVQRWLNDLIQQGRVRKEGRGRATRYWRGKIVHASGQVVVQVKTWARGEILIPLSPAGREIASHVRQALEMRTPVGYQRAFLDTYRPNESHYLPDETRAELLALGQALPSEQPAGTYARQLAHRLLIDLSWNSSRLEGNTYSLLETERLIFAGEAANGKNAQEAQMILNHKEAIEFLMAATDDIGFNRYTLLNLHALLADNLLPDPTAAGRLRMIPVGIHDSVFLPLEGPQLIDECFEQVLNTAAAIDDPFEQAFFAMVHLPYLQAFEDVNKRVSRLAANIPLIRRNLCPLSFVDVDPQSYISAMLGIYELKRIELLRDVFVWAYRRSCARYSAVRQSLGEPDPFRIQHRSVILKAVADVVSEKMDKAVAITHIRRVADELFLERDRARFIEIVENQLLSLHVGNIARYRLRPSEFQAWQAIWR